jgi:DsbC/DsbD-like thiol-disulfide interchange protein
MLARNIVAIAAAMAAALCLQLLIVGRSSADSRAHASGWVEQPYSKVRLVSGSGGGSQPEQLAGVHIRLAPGWKTYWSNPGDSGVPPSFDWKGSVNVKEAVILYPAPIRFADGDGTAIGYEGEVVFPMKITPATPGMPVELKLNVTFGICKTLCIPSEATLALALPAERESSSTRDSLLLDRFNAIVPTPVKDGELPTVSHVESKLTGQKPELIVEAEFPQNAAGTDVFASAPDITVAVPRPLGPPKAGKQRFSIAFISEEEAEALKGKALILTLVWDGGARETPIVVGGPGL